MITLFTSLTTASVVAKNGTKNYYTTMHKIIPRGQILLFELSKNHIGQKGEARTHGPLAPSVPKGNLGHTDRVCHWCQRGS